MLNYLCLATLCVCVFSAPLEKTTTTTTSTAKPDSKIQPIDNLTLIAHPAEHSHDITKREYDHLPVAVVSHEHYVSGAAVHAPILVSDDHLAHVAAGPASIALDKGSEHSASAAQAPTLVSREERSKDVKSEKLTVTDKPIPTSTTTTKPHTEAKAHSHPSEHLHTPATTTVVASTTTPSPSKKNHKRNTHVGDNKSASTDESKKLTSNPTIASPQTPAEHDYSNLAADSIVPSKASPTVDHPKADVTSAKPEAVKADKPSAHKHKRDTTPSKVAALSESPKKDAVTTTTPKVVVPHKHIDTHTHPAESKKTSEHAHHKRDTKKESTTPSKVSTSSESPKKEAVTTTTPKAVVPHAYIDTHTHPAEGKKTSEHAHHKRDTKKESTTDAKSTHATKVDIPAHVDEHHAKKEHTVPAHTELKRETPKETIKPVAAKDTKPVEANESSKKSVSAAEHSHAKPVGHEHHKRETKDEKNTLSNPTIATPSLLKSAAKVETDGKKVKPTTTTKKPENDAQNKPHKRDTKDAVASSSSEPLTTLSNPTIDTLLKAKSPPADFHTSHRIPEHIEARLHEDEKFQTSHQIPIHPAPVVVGVTPKKTDSTIKAAVPKEDAVADKKEELPKKDDTKDIKKPIGGRHRRHTSTTLKPEEAKKAVDVKKPAAKLAHVPLTKSTPIVEEAPKQQNGHAAHSPRPKRDITTAKPETKPTVAAHSGEDHHHAGLVFPVPVDKIVKHSDAAPEIHHHSHSSDAVHPAAEAAAKEHKDGTHKLDKKHVVPHTHSSTTETASKATPPPAPQQDAAISVKPVV